MTVAVDDASVAEALGAAAAGPAASSWWTSTSASAHCGVRHPADAVALAGVVAGVGELRLAGIMGYEGRVTTLGAERTAELGHYYDLLAETRAAVERAGFEVGTVSSAGTSSHPRGGGRPHHHRSRPGPMR